MKAYIEYAQIAKACNEIVQECVELPLGFHYGTLWLFDKAVDAFEAGAIDVSIPVKLKTNIKAEVTIQLDGSYILNVSEEDNRDDW